MELKQQTVFSRGGEGEGGGLPYGSDGGHRHGFIPLRLFELKMTTFLRRTAVSGLEGVYL